MSIVAVADTHAVIWYLYGDSRLSVRARQVFEGAAKQGNVVSLSSMTLAEIVYLIEKGRIVPTTLNLILAELDSATTVLVETPIDRHVIATMRIINRANIPELPDRIIAATASHLGVPLVSRDGKIQASGLITVW